MQQSSIVLYTVRCTLGDGYCRGWRLRDYIMRIYVSVQYSEAGTVYKYFRIQRHKAWTSDASPYRSVCFEWYAENRMMVEVMLKIMKRQWKHRQRCLVGYLRREWRYYYQDYNIVIAWVPSYGFRVIISELSRDRFHVRNLATIFRNMMMTNCMQYMHCSMTSISEDSSLWNMDWTMQTAVGAVFLIPNEALICDWVARSFDTLIKV